LRRVPATDPRIRLEILDIKAACIFDQEVVAAKFPGNYSKFNLAWKQYKELFTVRHLSRRLVIACLLQIIQQFTGINAIIYYAPQIFTAIGLTGNSVDLLAPSNYVSRSMGQAESIDYRCHQYEYWTPYRGDLVCNLSA
jgi:hypothetical protein